MDLVLNHSRRFVETPRSLNTICSVAWRTANPPKKENWRITDSVINPSRKFYESPRRFGMKRISTYIGCLKLKESL
jgi:hypothetical protein